HLLQRRSHDFGDLLVADLARSARTRLIDKAVQTLRGEPLTPSLHRHPRDPKLPRDHEVWQAGGGKQHDLRTHAVRPRDLPPSRPRFKLGALGVSQLDANRSPSRHPRFPRLCKAQGITAAPNWLGISETGHYAD